MKIADRLILALDTETTGPDPATARVVELGAVYFRNGDRLGPPLNVRINPGVPIPAGASEVHGITDAMVADAPTFADVAPRLLAHIEGRHARAHFGINERPLVVGYNILHYDEPVLSGEFGRNDADPISSTWGSITPFFDSEILDPFVFVQGHYRDKPAKLGLVCDAFGITLEHAHAAWADAQAAGRLVYRLLDVPENDRPPARPGRHPRRSSRRAGAPDHVVPASERRAGSVGPLLLPGHAGRPRAARGLRQAPRRARHRRPPRLLGVVCGQHDRFAPRRGQCDAPVGGRPRTRHGGHQR